MNKCRLWIVLWRVLIAALELTPSLSDWKERAYLFVGKYRDTPRKRKKQNLSQLLDVTGAVPNA